MELSDFETMVIKNTINDYYTPNIKSEVILDMLLTDYIPAILQASIEDKTTNDEQPAFRLITKEMSIGYANNGEECDTNRGKKVDYVVLGKNKIYLVELKTTQEYLSHTQKDTYEKVEENNDKAEYLLKRLCKIVGSDDGNNDGESAYESLENYFKNKLRTGKRGLQWKWDDTTYDEVKKNQKLVELAHRYQKVNGIYSTGKYIHTIACILQYTNTADWGDLQIVYISPKGIHKNDSSKGVTKDKATNNKPIIDITFQSLENNNSECLREFKESLLYNEIIKPLFIK